MRVLVDCTFSSVFVYLMMCGLFYFLQLNQRFAPLSCHALVLICGADNNFCCYSENVENRSIVISAFLRD